MKKFEQNVGSMDISALSGDFASPFTYAEQDFFVCEYVFADGELLTAYGGLFANCGMEVPQSLDALCAVPENWPLAESYRSKAAGFFAALRRQTGEGRTAPSLFEMLLEYDGRESWVCIGTTVLSRNGATVLQLRFSRFDNEKRELARLVDRSLTDPLTGTLNRAGLAQELKKLAAGGRVFAFLVLDIDGFKNFNNTYGHLAGDALLSRIAQRLADGLQPEDLIARVSGDVFIICIYNAEENESIQRTVRHMHAAVLENDDNLLSISIGVAMSPKDGTDFEDLYRKADLAMYCAKGRGGNSYLFYEPDMVMPGSEAAEKPRTPEVQHMLVHYHRGQDAFTYPPELEQVFCARFDERPLWQILQEDGVARRDMALRLRESFEQVVNGQVPLTFSEYLLRTADGMMRWFRIGMLAAGDAVCITFTDVNDELHGAWQIPEFDDVTGLLSHSAFARKVERVLADDPEGVRGGEYAMLYFDVVRFKAINDRFGNAEGDRLLLYIASGVTELLKPEEAVCRLISDQFAVLLHRKGEALDGFLTLYAQGMAAYNLGIEIVSNMGIYITTGEELTADAMLDRAKLAQAAIKGSYTTKYSFYSEEMRNAMLGEQEIIGNAGTALAGHQFVVFFQPQYDHSNGELIGAEALVRWRHPEHGLVPPGKFIPLFEKNGFITRLDFFVFEEVCRFQRRCMDAGIKPVPISVNLTRYDIYQPDFINLLENCRTRFDVPVDLLRIEITETAVVGDNRHATDIIEQLHHKGYVVEMDDFGSGYSSLNVLKDIALDILKLDMRFLTETLAHNRSGTILSAVVLMAKWLRLTVIAEGVETLQQADFLRSIGCNYVQGFMYARPMPEEDFLTLLGRSTLGETTTPLHLIETMNPGEFWNPESLDTLIFNNYVGGAAIFDYRDGCVELLRANDKYRQELGVALDHKALLELDPLTVLDEANRQLYTDMLRRAIETDEEAECETWRCYEGCPNGDVCIRCTVRVVGRSNGSCLFYASIRNITEEKHAQAEVAAREEQFRAASEQANIYYWVYDVATREMKPCFRCIRDLGLPELMTNYPESAFERGVFPPEAADEYREMHRRIEEGVREQEAVLPLTAERIPFRVRYTTKFDKHGKPILAYGSAVPV